MDIEPVSMLVLILLLQEMLNYEYFSYMFHQYIVVILDEIDYNQHQRMTVYECKKEKRKKMK